MTMFETVQDKINWLDRDDSKETERINDIFDFWFGKSDKEAEGVKYED